MDEGFWQYLLLRRWDPDGSVVFFVRSDHSEFRISNLDPIHYRTHQTP
jgi:hypothetical protein